LPGTDTKELLIDKDYAEQKLSTGTLKKLQVAS
jgi:hypothetical protein